MKLKNVHYEYRGNDIWRIYFKDYAEADAFRNERTDGQKLSYGKLLQIFINGKGVLYCVEAKLTGSFSILRHYVKDPLNDYFTNDIWRALVKKIEGADSDYIFDEIDLWYDATTEMCYFKICCMYGTWTELFVKNMVARANEYYDTDTAYQGGLCVRRSCCGIGIGSDSSTQRADKERIIFTVKNFCREDADIVKVSPWTYTFIGTNKENEKEYSWVDFKKYMGLLHANGSDIWDIEWKYDATCPMTGTEVADELHLYLKPLAYKRLFEKEERGEPTQLLKNITDVLSCATKVLGCSTLYYYNLYFDDKSDLKYVHLNQINRSMLNSVKGTYYIRVVSYNKELPKNISYAALVWDQEENRYSVEDFTIKGYRNEGKKIWLSTGSLWSNNDYLGRVKALTPPPVPYWMKQDDDCKIGFRQKDTDEVQKEIDEMTKRIYEKLGIKQVKDFDVDTMWYDYLNATETADAVCDYCEQDLKLMSEELAKDIKEDNNMKIYWDESLPRIENVRDIVLNGYKYDRSVYYYRVYFERVVDAKNITGRSYYQDMDKHCWYYMMIASTAELSEEMKGSIKTLYLTHDKNELEKTNYYINWKAMYAPLKAGEHFEMKMTAQVNEEQLKVWEAALGIGNLPKHKKEKTIGEVVNEFNEEQKKVLYYLIAEAQKSGKAKTAVTPTKILIQGTATIIWWSDGDKTVVKCQKGDKMDPEKGVAMAVMKKFMGTNETGSNYLDFAKKPIAEYEKQKQEAAKKRKQAADKKRRAQKKEADANKEV